MITADSIYNIDFSKYIILQINIWGDTEFTLDFGKLKKNLSKAGITILSRRSVGVPSVSIVNSGNIEGNGSNIYTKKGAYYSYLIHNSTGMCID